MTGQQETGKKGEELALRHLKSHGYEILETNWRSGFHEVDIIAKKGDFLVIVEVKTRTGIPMVEPETAVDLNKQKSLVKAANSYILRKNSKLETRFDIISIVLNGTGHQLYHIEDAFYPRLQR